MKYFAQPTYKVKVEDDDPLGLNEVTPPPKTNRYKNRKMEAEK